MTSQGKSLKLAALGLASAAAMLGLTSCLVGPDYEKHEMSVPAAFRGAPSMDTSIASLPWWDVIKDPDLTSLLLDTFRNNHSLKATFANVDSARQTITVTQAPIFPWLAYGGSVSKGANQSGGSTIMNSGGMTTAPGSLAASASWELDIWGRTRRSVESAEADYLSAEQELRSLQLSLLRQVATGYLQLLMLDEQLRIQKACVESYRQSLEYYEYRLQYEVSNILAVQSSRAALAAAQAQVPALETQIVQLENTLSVLAGRVPGHIRRRGNLTDYAGSSEVPTGIPADILAHRPDVLAAEQKIRSANAKVGVAIADYFPTITLTAAGGMASADLMTSVRKGTGWGMGASLSGPLFRAGSLRASEKIARNNLVAAVADYEDTVLTALSEVSSTLVQRIKLRSIMQKQEEAVVSYRSYLDACLERVKTGYSDYYEVLTAQQNLFPAEQKLAEYRYQYAACIPTLYAQLGGGWQQSSEEIRAGKSAQSNQAQ